MNRPVIGQNNRRSPAGCGKTATTGGVNTRFNHCFAAVTCRRVICNRTRFLSLLSAWFFIISFLLPMLQESLDGMKKHIIRLRLPAVSVTARKLVRPSVQVEVNCCRSRVQSVFCVVEMFLSSIPYIAAKISTTFILHSAGSCATPAVKSARLRRI